MTAAIPKQHEPGQRLWRDLSKRRLFCVLAFAPVPPIALGALLLWILGVRMELIPLGPILAAAETWSLLVGMVYVTIARARGVVHRAHCLLLGAFLAGSLPTAAFLTSKAVDWVYETPPAPEPVDEELADSLDGPSDGAIVFVLGVILVPFGTLGGWVFWRGGVYPARPKVLDVMTVFD
ncbi:hypothetical protein [Dongia sedimenti]|uniref:Uncharacterized protein n=1 Tax=Dongia sedimenti TaxID=3064282 RepID=A0ABU0YM26_9PROT|nr:hypothetical protein [Rhodospirillaceae bacterium R-7]